MPITRAYGQASQLGNTPAASNPVINGAFDIWQRGTSISVSASTAPYTADRWQVNVGANQATTVSRQTTSDTTNLPNIQYCARFQRNSGQTGTGAMYFTQSWESVNSVPFANKTVTLSFYARSGSNFSPTSSIMTSYVYYGTGTDQNITGTYTGAVGLGGQNNTLTTTWQRFSMTVTVDKSATEIALLFAHTPTGTASTNDYYEITGVQIDVGSVALPFRRAMNTLAGELAACQRYYYRQQTTEIYYHFGFGQNANNTTQSTFRTTFPVQMRSIPTLEHNYPTITYTAVSNGVGFNSSSAPVLDYGPYNSTQGVVVRFTSTGQTALLPAFFYINANANGYLAYSSEL